MDNYSIQILDGYTDGKPSWRKVSISRLRDRPHADEQLRRLQAEFPMREFRIRKATR